MPRALLPIRIDQIARELGTSSKTLVRLEAAGLVTFLRGPGRVRYLDRSQIRLVPFLTRGRAAKRLGRSRDTLARWFRRGLVSWPAGISPARRRRFSLADLAVIRESLFRPTTPKAKETSIRQR